MWTTEPWLLGESELDPGEWGFDGTIWAAPTKEEIARAEAEKGLPNAAIAEPTTIAQYMHKDDAKRACDCVNSCAGVPSEILLECCVADLIAIVIRLAAGDRLSDEVVLLAAKLKESMPCPSR